MWTNFENFFTACHKVCNWLQAALRLKKSGKFLNPYFVVLIYSFTLYTLQTPVASCKRWLLLKTLQWMLLSHQIYQKWVLCSHLAGKQKNKVSILFGWQVFLFCLGCSWRRHILYRPPVAPLAREEKVRSRQTLSATNLIAPLASPNCLLRCVTSSQTLLMGSFQHGYVKWIQRIEEAFSSVVVWGQTWPVVSQLIPVCPSNHTDPSNLHLMWLCMLGFTVELRHKNTWGEKEKNAFLKKKKMEN